MKKIKFLIAVLQDKEANVSEKDDAAMDLASSDNPLAVQALAAQGQDETEDDLVLNSCGESLAEIWIRNDTFVQNLYNTLLPKAQQGVRAVIESLKPEWKVVHQL
jgi:hypothetical protein